MYVDFTDIDKIKRLGNITLVSDIEDADIKLVGRNGEGDSTLKISRKTSPNQRIWLI